jgi:hypothetical protein
MTIDLSKLSPMCRNRLCDNAHIMLSDYGRDLDNTISVMLNCGVSEDNSTIKEFTAWRDACYDVQRQIVSVMKE